MKSDDLLEEPPADDIPSVIVVEVSSASEAALVDMVFGRPGVGERTLPVHGLLELARLSPHALVERCGLSLPDAMRFSAAMELGRRLQTMRARRPARIVTDRDAARFFRPILAPLLHEELWIAALDARNGVRSTRMLARGGLVTTSVTTADVLRAAVDMAAVKFVLAHNHPAGNPMPSLDDRDLTEHIERAANIIGIRLIHHVVLTPGDRWDSLVSQSRTTFR